jgi:hypothetical protein
MKNIQKGRMEINFLNVIKASKTKESEVIL